MKTKLFSVTKDDFEWQYFRGSGAGGQKKNKTSSACRCIHRPSGSVAESQEERSQQLNRKIAFSKCVNLPSFQSWLKITCAARAHGFSSIEKQINDMMREENLKVEYYTPDENS